MDNSLIVLILQIGVLLASGFLITYIKRKASNYADKKDLKDLTAIVEQEKSKYAADLSVIKAHLDIAVSNRNNYREKEVEVIAEFYSVCSWLVYDFLNLDIIWFNSAHYNKIEELSSGFFDNIKKMAVAKGKFDLFISDNNLRKSGHELHLACINYTGKVQLFANRLKFSLKNQIDFREKSLKYLKSGQRDIEQENKIIDEEREINKEVAGYPNEYMLLRKEENDTIVVKAIAQFESAARIYLSTTNIV
ncbi:MAG: hypothetical protein HYR66_00165 [Sphingobacteriales bacterium]|nr:hypothetical protein [Sphingobacteriales bacterium]MBI3717790.1 hypothetical protein [Sphingobacteriales bacterium]